ncbi:MAG: hypothetical protein KGD63_10730 [Candidatus Lokiarchaeota archaeon]|nr:hypothetical protein [Candidatus Lokiarchaeota archaeon]
MIEEEDEDAVLKQGTSWKKILKHIIIVLIIIFGVVIMNTDTIKEPSYRFITGFMIICFGTSILQIKRETSEPKRQTLTISLCKICKKTHIRHYEEGDFVYKSIEKCNKCNVNMEIAQIYSVKLKGPLITSKKGKFIVAKR